MSKEIVKSPLDEIKAVTASLDKEELVEEFKELYAEYKKVSKYRKDLMEKMKGKLDEMKGKKELEEELVKYLTK